MYDRDYFERMARDPLNDRAPWRPSNGDWQFNENNRRAEIAERSARQLLAPAPLRFFRRVFGGRS